jgi:hypothetical protein
MAIRLRVSATLGVAEGDAHPLGLARPQDPKDLLGSGIGGHEVLIGLGQELGVEGETRGIGVRHLVVIVQIIVEALEDVQAVNLDDAQVRS